MQINVEVNNVAKNPVADGFFAPIIKETISKSEISLSDKNISISVALVPPKEIKRLNKEYRQMDSATDVLSFAEYPNTKAIEGFSGSELFLGELILCYDDIKRYAQEQKKDTKKELATVTAHGVLHLLGFQHGEKMFSLQENLANNF